MHIHKNSIRIPFLHKQALYFLRSGACLLFLLFLSFSLHAQESIKGMLVDATGKPVPGASVSNKLTKEVIQTNADGAFYFQGNDSIIHFVVSCVGYQPAEITWRPGQKPLLIKLQFASKELANVEVVSSGYQDIPKERITGSFVKIDNATLNQQTGTNILQRLNGVTSGLLFSNASQVNSNPQNKTNISIRGLSTIQGPLDPLVVLDGFIYEGDINNINPNEVDNITILKDATAASIWGARAGNGVIVITTKKGRLNQKLQVSFNVNTIITKAPDLSPLPLLSSESYINTEQFLFNQGYYDGNISVPYQALTPAVQLFAMTRDGLLSAADSATRINALKAMDAREQYNKYVYSNAVTQQYAININGGNSNNAYTLGIGYDRSVSELNAPAKKLNIKIDNLFQLTKSLRLSAGAYYTNSHAVSGRQGYGITYASQLLPYLQLADANGNALPVATQYNDAYVDTAGGGKLLDWHYYPLDDYKHSKTINNLQEIYATAGLQYKISHSFDLDIKYQYQQQSILNEQTNDIGSYAARDLVNQFTQIDQASGVVTYIVPYGGFKTSTNSNVSSYTGRAQLNFNHSRGRYIIAAIAGAETRQLKETSNRATVYGYNDDPLSVATADFINSYPSFITGNYSTISSGINSSSTVNRFVSYYGNAACTWSGLYTISGSLRRDGSNIFGLNTNDKWNPLWSIGAAWKLSAEPFYHVGILPVLKLRASYGYSGNVDLTKSSVAVGNYYSGYATNLPIVRINTINNPDLRWEKTGIVNIAADFESKNNIISGSLEYYTKKGTDLYGRALYDYTTWGFSNSITSNVAAIKGKGVDLTLKANIVNRQLKWNSGLLFNYNKNKTTRYNSDASKDIRNLVGNTGGHITPFIGRSLYGIAAYKWGGLDTAGNPQGYVNGELSTDYQAIFAEASDTGLQRNIIYKGSSVPVVFGAFSNTVSWKGFSLSANVVYRFGYYFQRASFSSSGLVAGQGHKDYEKRWQHPGDEKITSIPAFVYPANGDRDNFFASSEINVLKADNVRLQYVNLSWSFNNSRIKKIPFTAFEFYINAANLGILWKANKAGIDPDYPQQIRPSKAYTFGLRTNL